MDTLYTDKTGTWTQGVVNLDGAIDVTREPSLTVLCYAYLNAKLQTGLVNPLGEAILAQAQPDLADLAKLGEIPYDFERKRLSVVMAKAGQPLLQRRSGVGGMAAPPEHPFHPQFHGDLRAG